MSNDIKDLEGLEMFLGYSCNVKCSFCYQGDLRIQYKKNISKEKVIELILNGYNEGKRFIIFSGGEATLDKNLGYYIGYSKGLGFEHIRVHTNGFGFRKYEYLQDLYYKGLTGVIISIHGYKSIHDSISRVPGSFNTILKALINFQKLKIMEPSFVFDTNTVICKQNYKHLDKLLLLLQKFSLTRGQLVIPYSLDLYTQEEKIKLIPQYQDCIPYIKRLLDIGFLNKQKFVIENIPFCLIDKKYWPFILNNIKTTKEAITITDTYDSNLDDSWMKKTKECQSCSMNTQCKGIPSDYIDAYPNIQLQPIIGRSE